MKELAGATIGIDEGDEMLFSEFEHKGPMWVGKGQREKRRGLRFDRAFRAPPSVFVALSMWDMDSRSNARADLSTENITETGFDVVFRTWGDTRVARARVRWMAIGPVLAVDEWDIP